MILKNLIIYLQIFTLTASLTNDNTGTKSNQREGSTLESINVDQYQPNLKVLQDFVSNEPCTPPSKKDAQQTPEEGLQTSKQSFDPKTPTANILGKGPAWVKNVAKHFKDKSLEEEYKRTERAVYPSGSEINDGTILLEEFVETSHPESPTLNEVRDEVSVEDDIPDRRKKVCFVDDSKSKKSVLVPCHFVSRLFYLLILHNHSHIRIMESTKDGKPTQKFDVCASFQDVVCPQDSPSHHDVSNKTNEADKESTDDTDVLVEPARKGSDEVKSTEPSKPVDDVIPVPKDRDMPSFDEWKMQQEENKDHIKDQNSAQNHLKPKVGKKEINYASVTCGSKVVQANPEAQNPSFMLYENKDQYMINPCSAKMGFTVELCESIQVQSIELGNIEFFSSLPRSFDVHISERFPVKEWIHVGTFDSKNERTIQNFPVERSLAYAKYVRIDISSHYGNEHFCPISVLRVFGVSLDEDDEVEVSQEEADYSDIVDVSDKKGDNLFSKATDTVISIIKIVVPSADAKSETIDEITLETPIVTALDNATMNEEAFVATKYDNVLKCLLDYNSLPQPQIEIKSVSTFCEYYKLLSGRYFNPICPKPLPDIQAAPIEKMSSKKEADPKISLTTQESTIESSRKDFVDVEDQNLNKIPDKSSADCSFHQSIIDDPKNGDDNKHNSDKANVQSDKKDKTSEQKEPIKIVETSEVISESREENSRSVDSDKRSSNSSSNATKGGASNNQSGSPTTNEGGDSSTNQKKEPANDGSPRLEPLKDYEIDPSNMDDVTYQKLSSKGKESVFVKLKNRIRNLEVNLNLTNRYLEELSQRYKKQTEEMYTSLNKTISKLIITAKSAEERDLKQQDRIQSLEIKFSNLTTMFSSLHRSMQDVHSEVLERHLLMMAVEFALFFALLTYCRGHRRPQPCDHHCRRSSAPAIPGKVVTFDPAKVVSKNRGDVGACSEEEREGDDDDDGGGGDDDDAGGSCSSQTNLIQTENDLSLGGEEPTNLRQPSTSVECTNNINLTNNSASNGMSCDDDDDDDIGSGVISSIEEVRGRGEEFECPSQIASSHKERIKTSTNPLPTSTSPIFNDQSTSPIFNDQSTSPINLIFMSDPPQSNNDVIKGSIPSDVIDDNLFHHHHHQEDDVRSDFVFVNHDDDDDDDDDDDLYCEEDCDDDNDCRDQHLKTSSSSPLINKDISGNSADLQTSSSSPNISNPSSSSPNISNPPSSSPPPSRLFTRRRKFSCFPVVRGRGWSRKFVKYSKERQTSFGQYLPRECILVRVRYRGGSASSVGS